MCTTPALLQGSLPHLRRSDFLGLKAALVCKETEELVSSSKLSVHTVQISTKCCRYTSNSSTSQFRSIACDDGSQHVECKDSTIEGESDAGEEAYVPENDFEITGEQSHTLEETVIAHEEAGNTSGKSAATGAPGPSLKHRRFAVNGIKCRVEVLQ